MKISATFGVGQARALALVGLALCLGCRASAHGSAGSEDKTRAELRSEEFGSLGERGLETGDSVNDFAVDPTASPDEEGALFGARHDVFLSRDLGASCKCLSAVAAQPGDPRLGWESKRPLINPNTQLIVAFRGLPCPEAPANSLGVAYRGYVKSNNDVIVMLEEAKPGRPTITGAIIPKPKGQGRLLFEPVPETLPWGQPLAATDELCKVSVGK